MGHFTNKIVAVFTPPKTWKLEEELAFREPSLKIEEINTLKDIGVNIKDSGTITRRVGMKTDLASVPRICWALFISLGCCTSCYYS